MHPADPHEIGSFLTTRVVNLDNRGQLGRRRDSAQLFADGEIAYRTADVHRSINQLSAKTKRRREAAERRKVLRLQNKRDLTDNPVLRGVRRAASALKTWMDATSGATADGQNAMLLK